ncbi:hypothetical protein F4778DRAFT_710223 [Xylariomycetidae sp. FL2044]|nr:hypothetical protein F4778DRAFT_710223 [Xylariomycetidae sp. FL2044]
MVSCALPYCDKPTNKVEDGVSCAGCQLALHKTLLGNLFRQCMVDARDQLYSQEGFLEHFRWCVQAQLLWETSGEGQYQPAELPEAAQRRGYFGTRE